MDTVQFGGQSCIELKNNRLMLLVTQSVGPRVIALKLHNGQNVLAELPNLTVGTTAANPFHFYGGHRLWHAPEVPDRTYLPDDEPVTITRQRDGICAVSKIEPRTGIEKCMVITLVEDAPVVVVEHKLTNYGLWSVETAPWAITQLKCGGTAILPQAIGAVDAAGVQPNRALTLWPYSDIKAPDIDLGNKYLLIEATPGAATFKVGFPNRRGWIAYYLKDQLFVKYAVHDPERQYYDLGASGQCYRGPDFVELETLGPRSTIAPSASVSHKEVWRLLENIPTGLQGETLIAYVDELELDEFAVEE